MATLKKVKNQDPRCGTLVSRSGAWNETSKYLGFGGVGRATLQGANAARLLKYNQTKAAGAAESSRDSPPHDA